MSEETSGTQINGPLRILVAQEPGQPGWQLVVSFAEDFKSATLEEQGRRFAAYRQELAEGIGSLPAGDRNRDGMAIVLQLVEELLPYIQAGEIALEAPIVVQIGQSQAVSITDFLGA